MEIFIRYGLRFFLPIVKKLKLLVAETLKRFPCLYYNM